MTGAVAAMVAMGAKSVEFAFLQAASDTTNLTTYTFTSQNFGAENSARRILAVITNYDMAGASSNLANSCTIGGVSATKLVEAASDFEACSIWQALVPTGADGTVAVTFAAGVLACAISLFRCVNVLAAAHATATDLTGDPTSVSINCPANGIILAGNAIRGTGSFTWTNLTERYDAEVEAAGVFTAAGDFFSTQQTGLSISCDSSTNDTGQALAVVSLDPDI